ncbi:MAG: hypothetical protein AAFY88_31775, partial [Acidobacteriota bacterium]
MPILGEALLANEGRLQEAIRQINDWHTRIGKTGYVLPLLVNDAWRLHQRALHMRSVRRELYGDLTSALMEVLATVSRTLAANDDAPSLYISYAAEDSTETDAAAQRISDVLKTHAATAEVFDDVCLLVGDELEKQLHHHASDGMLIVVRSDRASSLAWCQREILRAKHRGWPTLVVELLLEGEDRSFPYGGNTPTVRWRRGRSPERQSQAIALRSIVEAVAWRHHQLEAERVIKAAQLPRHNVEIFARPPELLDVSALLEQHPGPVLALHPDPELSVHERQVLLETHPRLRLLTPASSFRGHLGRTLGSPLRDWRIGFSFADSPDVDGPEGTTDQHIG